MNISPVWFRLINRLFKKYLTLPHQEKLLLGNNNHETIRGVFNMIHTTNLPLILKLWIRQRAIAAEPAARAWQHSFGWMDVLIILDRTYTHDVFFQCQKSLCAEIKKHIPQYNIFGCEYEKSVWSQNKSWRQHKSNSSILRNVNWAMDNLTSVPRIHLNVVDLGANST